MAESCVSEELNPEELQIFNQHEFLGNNFHPDAHACRLKLSAVTVVLDSDIWTWRRRNDLPLEHL